MDQLTPLLGKPYARTRQIQRFDGFAQMVYNDLTRGAIKGSATTDALASGVATLAFALETPVPYPSLTATTVHPPKAVHKARKVNSLRKRASGKKVHSGKKLASAKKVASGQKVHSGKKLASGHKVRSGGRPFGPEARRPQEVATGRRGHVELDHSHNQGRAPDNAGGGGALDFVPVVNGVHGPAHYKSQSALDHEASFA